MTTVPDLEPAALEACPFCGGKAELHGHQAPEFWVACPAIGCKASTEGFGSKDRAIAAWNRRASCSTVRKAVDACLNVIEQHRQAYERERDELIGKANTGLYVNLIAACDSITKGIKDTVPAALSSVPAPSGAEP